MRKTGVGRILVVLAATAWLSALAQEVRATPNLGRSCSGCHGRAYDDGTVTGNTGTLNPAGGSGALKVFPVAPGGTIPLTFTVTGNDGGDNVGVALLQLNNTALGNTHTLPYTADPLWTGSGSGTSRYFYTGYPGLTNALGARTFNLLVGGTAVPGDIYTLRFNSAGGLEDWNDSESFYLQITPEPTSMAMLGIGALALLRRKRRAA